MSTDTCPLEHVSSFDPVTQKDFISHTSGKPCITNTTRDPDGRRMTAIDARVILERINEITNNSLVTIAGDTVVKSAQGNLEIRKTDKQLFAWLHDRFTVDWQGSPGITKPEFLEYCRDNAPRYLDSTAFPHHPVVEQILYHHQAVQDGTGEALEEFLNFFTPATPTDRELIRAFILTAFWGGQPGARPAFLITSDDTSTNQGRGYGKTTLLEMCAALCGGILRISQAETVESISKRIVNQANNKPRPRIVAIDNVKTRRFSWAEFESMITASDISGHKLWAGNQPVANFHTFAVTINGPCLAKDLAQRFVVIKLGKPAFTNNWQNDVMQYIQDNRWRIIGDVIQQLRTPCDPMPNAGMTRFGSWEQGVLCRVNNPQHVRHEILQRQEEYDDDDATREEFQRHVFEHVSCASQPCALQMNGLKPCHVAHETMYELYKTFIGEKIGKNTFRRRIEQLGLKSLKCISRPGTQRIWLFNLKGLEITEQQVSMIG